jgi:hypothetical protein
MAYDAPGANARHCEPSNPQTRHGHGKASADTPAMIVSANSREPVTSQTASRDYSGILLVSFYASFWKSRQKSGSAQKRKP